MSGRDWHIAREEYVSFDGGTLFVRECGRGQPIILVHGGPDFDHTYLLRLADTYRLIYYDQRGRGRSAPETQPDDVTMATDVADLHAIQSALLPGPAAILGHSWGGLLALEYAIQHPAKVSHLILMDTAPASYADAHLLLQAFRDQHVSIQAEMDALEHSEAYQAGDPDVLAALTRLHFSSGVLRADHLDLLIARLRESFEREGILRGRAIEERLQGETWGVETYDLFPALARLNIATLVLHGDADFIPLEIAAHVAQAIPGAQLVVLKDCGHFASLEAPEQVRAALAEFFERTERRGVESGE